MKKNILVLIIAMVMVVLEIFSPFTGAIQANDKTDALGNIFTFDYFKVNGVDIVDNSVITVDANTEISLRYKWELDNNHGLVAGDYVELSIPGAFTTSEVITGDLIVLDGQGPATLNVGEYSFETATNKLRFTFNNNIVDRNIKDGYIGLELSFDLDYFEENVTQSIPFNDTTNKNLTITLKPQQVAKSIDKLGIPDSQVDASSIDWTITLLNTETTPISDGLLVDKIPTGLALDTSSVIIKPITIGYSGQLNVANTPIAIDPTNITYINQLLSIDMDTLQPYAGYQITYQTTFEDLVSLSFSNEAEFTSTTTGSIKAVATVKDLTRSSWIEKTGQVVNPNEISWTIDVNKAGNVINDAMIKDVFDQDVTLESQSITIYKIVLENGSWKISGNPVFTDQTSFPIQLGALTNDDAYRIIYNTVIDYPNNYSKTHLIDNKAELYDGNTILGEAASQVTINRLSILSKSSTSNLSFDNKTITWKVTINAAKHNMSNVIFSDVIPQGLEYVGGSLSIKQSNMDVTSDYTLETSGQNLRVDLGAVNKKTYIIEYKTTITDFTLNKTFVNQASLSGDGIDQTSSTTSSIKPADNNFSKSFVGVDYKNKTMTWRLGINPIKEPITKLTITDTFPNNGLILLEDTVEVKVNNVLLAKDTDYTLNPIGGNYNQGFELVFATTPLALPLNQVMTITYTTSFDPEAGIIANSDTVTGRKYKNKAVFVGKTATQDFTIEKEANTTLREDAWKSGKKEGKRVHDKNGELTAGWVSGYPRLIKWDIYTNYLEQDLGRGVTIEDTLAYEGVIDPSSFIISVYDVNKNGTTVNTPTIVDQAEYEVVLSNSGKTVDISFKDPAFTYDKRYVISFISSVPDVSIKNYSNDAFVRIKDQEEPSKYTQTVSFDEFNKFLSKAEAMERSGNNAYVDEEINWEVTLNQSLSILANTLFKDTMSSGLVLIKDSIQVIKLNKGIEEVVPNSNYQQTITNNDLDALVPTELTINFNADYIMDSTHIIRYKTVVVADQGSISNNADFSGDTLETVTVQTPTLTARKLSFVGGVSSPSTASIKIIKSDKATELPMDSTFELYYLINGEKKVVSNEQITTSNGEYTFNNLSFRTYYLKEVSAPQGYTRIKEDIKIVLNSTTINQDRINVVSIKNVKTLVLEKEASLNNGQESYHKVNEVIAYKVTATNTGEETLSSVKIMDDKEGLVDITFDVIDKDGKVIAANVVNGEVTLEPTQSLVMRASYTITQNDVDVQVINNKATVIGYDENNEELKAEAEATVEGKYQPEIDLEKFAKVMVNQTQSKESVGKDNSLQQVGEWIAYSVIATNSGNITLHEVNIKDDKANLVDVAYYLLDSNNQVISTAINGQTILKPGQKLLMSAMYQSTQEDLNQGSVSNTATVIAYPEDPNNPNNPNQDEPLEDEDDATIPVIQVSEILLIKTSSGVETSQALGVEISYTFIATNIGNTTLTNVVIEDDLVNNLEYVSLNGVAVDTEQTSFVLHSGDVLEAKASYVITQQDINEGFVLNEAFVSGQDVNEEPVDDDDQVTTIIQQEKKLVVSKTSAIVDKDNKSKKYFNTLNDRVDYTIVVINTGNTTANDVRLKESMMDVLVDVVYTQYDAQGVIKKVMSQEDFKDVILEPQEKIIMTSSYFVKQKDLDKGSIDNAVRVTALDDDGEVLGDEEEFDKANGLYRLDILKVDANDASKVLEGAIFVLTNSTTNQTWTIITDKDGKAFVDELEVGTYTLVESKAPEGYQLSNQVIDLIIGEDDSTIELTITNEEKSILPDTSDSVLFVSLGIGLLLFGGLLLILTRRVKKD